MKIDKQIVALAAGHAKKMLTAQLPAAYCYHNLAHTEMVVKTVAETAKGINISGHERHILVTAAWFHDLGYTQGEANHEQVAATMAGNFLEAKEVDAADIQSVTGCILATRFPQNPQNLLQQIICDADLVHVGKKCYFKKTGLIRQEWQHTRAIQYSEAEWRTLNIRFLQQHRFHTSYCRQQYEAGKMKNLRCLEEQAMVPTEKAIRNDTGNSGTKELKLHRGVETLFRTASRNHMQLSSMADSKAHILMSINSIIISIIISVLLKKLEESQYLVFPTTLLLVVCTVSVVFAVLTTKPKISKGVFTRDQVANREANLLFFGNFHKMDKQTYNWGVREMMGDAGYLYSSMTNDIYYIGKVLAVKYRYLRIGYMVFMIGMIVSVISFGVCFALR